MPCSCGPKIKKMSEFARLTLKQEFAGELNGYSLEQAEPLLARRGKPRSRPRA
jgi:hypothetical protein